MSVAENRQSIMVILDDILTKLASPDFDGHIDERPLLYVQHPFRGTFAIIQLRAITNPEETLACMNVVRREFERFGIEVLVMAEDLSTITISE